MPAIVAGRGLEGQADELCPRSTQGGASAVVERAMPSATSGPCRAILCLACVIVSAAAMACGSAASLREAPSTHRAAEPLAVRESDEAPPARADASAVSQPTAAAETVHRDGDGDGDGVADAHDRCPADREIVNAVEDDDGCPDSDARPLPEPVVEVPSLVFFENDSASLDASAYEMIARIAWALRVSGDTELVAVIGHVDAASPHGHALALERARSVVAALVSMGVAPERLVAVEAGATAPRVRGRSVEALAQNRRVEFHVLRACGREVARWDARRRRVVQLASMEGCP